MVSTRPIYRWKSLWLGVFVLGFLCWAWRDSFHRAPGVARFQSGQVSQLIHIQGKILYRQGGAAGILRHYSGWEFHTKTDSDDFSLTSQKAYWDDAGDDYQSIPDAPIIGFTALSFVAFIAIRKRRWKCHAAKLAAITADTTQTP